MRTGSDKRVLLAPVAVVACCGASTLAATAAGATVLGLAIHAWAPIIAGLLIAAVVTMRTVRAGQS